MEIREADGRVSIELTTRTEELAVLANLAQRIAAYKSMRSAGVTHTLHLTVLEAECVDALLESLFRQAAEAQDVFADDCASVMQATKTAEDPNTVVVRAHRRPRRKRGVPPVTDSTTDWPADAASVPADSETAPKPADTPPDAASEN